MAARWMGKFPSLVDILQQFIPLSVRIISRTDSVNPFSAQIWSSVRLPDTMWPVSAPALTNILTLLSLPATAASSTAGRPVDANELMLTPENE